MLTSPWRVNSDNLEPVLRFHPVRIAENPRGSAFLSSQLGRIDPQKSARISGLFLALAREFGEDGADGGGFPCAPVAAVTEKPVVPLQLVQQADADSTEMEPMLAHFSREMGLKVGAQYIQKVQHLVRSVCKHAKIDSPALLTHNQIMAYIDDARLRGIKKPKRRSGTIGLSTVRIYIVCLQTFYQWALRMELVKCDPTAKIPKPPASTKTQRAFTLDEVSRMIACAEKDEQSAQPRCKHQRSRIYRFLALTGCRIGEAEQLRWSDCELGAETPVLNIRGETNHARSGRAVALTIEDAKWLEAMRTHEAEEKDFVFGKRPHDRAIKRDMEEAHVPLTDKHGRGGSWHCFRRFVGTELARLRVSPKEAQARLGHKNVTTTLLYYTDEKNLEQSRVATAIADIVNGGKEKSAQRTCVPSDDVVDSNRQSEEHMRQNPTKPRHFEARPAGAPTGVEAQSGRGSIGRGCSVTSCNSVRGCEGTPPNGVRNGRAVALLRAIADLLEGGGK